MTEARKRDTRIKRRTFSVLVENEPGVLARVAGLFSARGFNIASLAVGETHDPTMSRMTIVVDGDDVVLEQVNKQLNKIIPVVSVRALHDDDCVSRELLLVKVKRSEEALRYVGKTPKERHVQIIDESPEHYILQAVISAGDTSAFLKELEAFGVTELSRTGQVAMAKKYRVGIQAPH